MKKFFLAILFFVFLHASPSFALGGEIVISNGSITRLIVKVSTETQAWKWDETNQKVIPEETGYSKTYDSITDNYKFDSPNSMNDGLPYFPWGLMKITIRSNNPASTKTFVLDTRDEDWPENTQKYPAHDTYISRNSKGEWQISTDYNTSLIGDNQRFNIWTLWNVKWGPVTTHFTVPVTLMNRTEGGNYDFGYLMAYDGVSGGENGSEKVMKTVISGQNGMFIYNIQNTVSHGTPMEGSKYSFKWENQNVDPVTTQNVYDSILNFKIPENNYPKSITRYFHQVYPLTVKNDLEGLSTSADSIFFKDPTTTNVLEKKPASGAGFVKNEAFANLDEYINTVPHQEYALKAKSIIQYGGLEYRWYGGDFNPSTSTDIMVSNDTTKTAHYKAHLRSSILTATGGSGSQRKIAKDYTGKLHMVYESVGKIWYTTSTDGGVTWSFEQPISGSGTASSPSIASSISAYPFNDVFCVWQETSGSVRNLFLKSLQNTEAAVLLDSDASSIDLQPSVAVSSDDYAVLVAYKKMNAGKYQLHYKYSDDCGYSFQYGGPVFVGTPIMDNNPSIAWNQELWKFMVSATYTAGSPRVNLYSFDYYDPFWDMVANMYSSSQIPAAPVYSQVAVDGTGRTHVSWIAYDDYYGNNSAAMHRSYKDGVLSGISTFRDEVIYEPSIIYATLSGHNDALDGGVSMFYSAGSTMTLFNMVSTNGTSWNGITYITPSAPIKYPTALEKAAAGSVTYVTAKGSALPYQIAAQTVSNTSSGGSYRLKPASENASNSSSLENVKTFRRMEIIDTTSKIPGRVVVQMGNFKGGRLSFYKSDSLKKKEIPLSSFMRTEGFMFEKDASVSTDFWVKKTGWKSDVKVTLELVEEGSGKVFQKVSEQSLGMKDSISEEKTLKVKNGLGSVKAYLRVSVDGIAKENLIVNNMDYYLLSSGEDKVQKPEQEIVESEIAPVEYALSQNFPNPFNPSTVINFQIPKASKVTLRVYDMLGKEVATLVDGYKEMGRYSVQFNASNLPSGTYIYEIRANDFVKSGKMLLLK